MTLWSLLNLLKGLKTGMHPEISVRGAGDVLCKWKIRNLSKHTTQKHNLGENNCC